MSEEMDRDVQKELLKDELDLQSLKIAELKDVLISNDIKFKAHDKKSQLIELVESNLKDIKKNARHSKKKKSRKTETEDSVEQAGKVSKKKKSKSSSSGHSDKKPTNIVSDKLSGDEKIKKEEEDVKAKSDMSKRTSKKRKNKADHDDENSDVEAKKSVKKARTAKSKKKVKKEKTDKGSFSTPTKNFSSPIAKKITSKTPVKSPHRSLVIDKFESSDDISDDNDKDSSFANFEIKRKLVKAETSSASETPASEQKIESASENITDDISKFDEEEAISTPIKIEVGDKTIEEEEPRLSTPEFPTLEEVEKLQEKVERSIQEKESSIVETEDESSSEIESDSLDQQEDEEAETSESRQSFADSANYTEGVTNKEPLLKRMVISIGQFSLKTVIYLIIVVPILFGLWYRDQRLLVGFCGFEIDLPTFQDSSANPYLNKIESELANFKPQCLPCPPNAICYPYMEMNCKPGYIIDTPLISLHGLIPVSGRCIKDSKKQKLIQEVVKKTLELLRTKNAQVSCGEDEDDCKSGISNEELYEIFYESKKPWINDEEFDTLWEQVMSDLMDEPEIIWRQLSAAPGDNKIPTDSEQSNEANGDPETEGQEGHFQQTEFDKGYFRSSSKKYIGLKCQFERQIYRTWRKYQAIIVASVLTAALAQLLKRLITKKFHQQERIDRVVQKVVDALQENIIAKRSSPYMSSVQLRDTILHDIQNLNEKNKIWKHVTKRLDSNTNIKSTLLEIHGEIMKCWEWIGVLPASPATSNGHTAHL